MEELLIRYLHFLAILSLASGLMVEQFLISKKVSSTEMNKIASADALCGVAVLLIIVTGTLLWFFYGKPAEFYSENRVFYIKLIVFAVLIVLAIYPATFFIRNRNSHSNSITIPQNVIFLIKAELVLLITMPLLAVFMARGYGHN